MIDEGLYSCQINDEERMLELNEDNHKKTWTTIVNLQVQTILSQEKKQTVVLKVNINDTILKVVDLIGDLFGETKYSITLFAKGKKLNLNQKIANVGIGYTNCSMVSDT